MVLKSYKNSSPDDWEDWPTFNDNDGDQSSIRKTTSMKNIFIDTKVKKLKFSENIADKIKFGSVKSLMEISDGHEAYLGSYSETEFYAYRYQKVYDKYPDVLRIENVNSEKFLIELFKYVKVPETAFCKSIEDKKNAILLNSIIFSFFDVESINYFYLHLDRDEANFYYSKELERNTANLFYLIISLIKGYITPTINKNKIFVVYQSQNGFEKTGFDIKKVKVDLNDNYNEGFEKISEDIVKGLNDKKKSNLVILSGEPGTGKTTFIRYLTSKIKKNIIFIAPDMVNHITDPSFIPFLIKNNDSVLIIEDAEPALKTRSDGRTGGVSNVLNLTDGLLSDCLNISIVATFNTKEENIDKALLRKGRLLKNYKFERLEIEKSKNLLKKLGREDVEVKEAMTLADIYYCDDDNNAQMYKTKGIGFNK